MLQMMYTIVWMIGCIVAFITDIYCICIYMCVASLYTHVYCIYYIKICSCLERPNLTYIIYNMLSKWHIIYYTMIITILQVAMSYSKDFKHCGQQAWSVCHINLQQWHHSHLICTLYKAAAGTPNVCHTNCFSIFYKIHCINTNIGGQVTIDTYPHV